MKDICRRAVDAARQAGATYADARVVAMRNQTIATEDERVAGIHNDETLGVGIRTIADGAWGFAASAHLDADSVGKAARQSVAIAKAGALAKAPDGLRWAEEPVYDDVFRTPIEKDPFAVSLGDKIDLLLWINRAVNAVKGVSKSQSHMRLKRMHRFLANSEGTMIESEVYTVTARCNAVAVGDQTMKTRYFEAPAANAGYEHIENTPLLDEATRVGEEAVEHLSARPSPSGPKDLILLPSHLALTMHESIGHPTELDRALGMEESCAGSNFATPDLLNNLQYGSPLMNVVCDNTMPMGCSTMGWDDDAVAGQRWHLVRDGVFVDYQTNREVCHAVGAPRSHGGCRAQNWTDIPILRQSNFSLEPGREPLTLDELIADTDDGILIDGMGSFSIDQKRYNFQFGGDAFWEIKKGKVTGMLKDVVYHAITTEFWNSLDALCDQRFWEAHGVLNCGKGDPMQAAQMSHASPPARFRNVQIGGAK